MARVNVDAFLIPRFDAHQAEYCAPSDERLAYVTGFTGSAGAAIIGLKKAVLFVDGRYQVQARREVSQDHFELTHLYDDPPEAWLARELASGDRVGFDPMLIPPEWDERIGATVAHARGSWVALDQDPVAAIWTERPQKPLGMIRPFPPAMAGLSSAEKRSLIEERLRAAGADLFVETQPDNIAWLLNVRGADVAHNPVPHSFLIFEKDRLDWLVDSRKLPNERSEFELQGVTLQSPDALLAIVKERCAGRRVLLDPSFSPAALTRVARAAGAVVVHARSPVTEAKAVKNEVELAGFRSCHVQDAVAWVSLLAWIDQTAAPRATAGRPITEREASDMATELRRTQRGFVEPSFEPIVATGGNAAMCHYAPPACGGAAIVPGQALLVDAGGQYLGGTTDATRTYAVGHVGDRELRTAYTVVLKGFISMMSLRFPKGTQGHHLDAIARRPLWDRGMDYDHGTGHGVGHFLHVHEQPQRFDKKINEIRLAPGMVTTIEPGYYVSGRYGVRIENQVEVVERDGFLAFESLTLVPIDLSMLELDLLTVEEAAWVDRYHARVREAIAPLVDRETGVWLRQRTVPLCA